MRAMDMLMLLAGVLLLLAVLGTLVAGLIALVDWIGR